MPTVREVGSWLVTIERLWDDPEWEAKHRSLALAEAARWQHETLAGQYEHFFSLAAFN